MAAAESVIIPVKIEVSGKEKVEALSRTLEKLSKGYNLGKYWKTYQSTIDNLTSSFEEYTNAMSRGESGSANHFGQEMIKNLNALDAALEVSGKKLEEFDLKGFDIGSIRSEVNNLLKNSDMENISLKFSKDNFKDFGVAIDYMKSFNANIGDIFNQLANSSDSTARFKQLEADAASAEETIRRLKSTIASQQGQIESYSSGAEFGRIKEECEQATVAVDKLEAKLTRTRDVAKKEFSDFLAANNLDTDQVYGQFSNYFEEIERGYYRSSQEAIQAFKGSEDAFLLNNSANLDTTQVQQFISMLGTCSSQVAEVRSEISQLAQSINTIGTRVPLEGLAEGLSQSADLTQEQRSQLTSLLSESQGLNSVNQIISIISSSTKETDSSIEGLYSTITQLVSQLKELGGINFDSLRSIEGIFKSVSNMGDFNAKESSFNSLFNFITKLNELESTGNIKQFSGLDFSGFNNLKIKPDTVNALSTLIESMNGVNISGVKDISGLNFDWIEKLKIGKTSQGALSTLKDFLNGVRDLDTSGLSTAANLNFDWVEKLSIKKSALNSLEQLKSFLSAVSGLDVSNLETSLNSIDFSKIGEYINANIKPIDASKLIDTSTESAALSGLIGTINEVIAAVERKNQAFLEEQAVVTSVVDSELTSLGTLWATIDDIANAAKDINPGKMFSTASFNKMVSNIKNFSTADFDTLQRLANINLSGLGVNVKGKSFQTLVNGLRELSQIGDLSNLKALNNIDLTGFSDIKVSEKSFSNLVNGIRELSTMNLSELEKLSGIDLSGLNNLQYVGKVGNGVVKESKNFIDTQNKQIEDSLKRYRDAGLTEEQLQPIKDMRELLNSSFTSAAMLDMTDASGSMETFVSMLSEAINECDDLAAGMKKVAESTTTATSDFNKYKTLLNKEKGFLDKKVKNGKLTDLETLDFNEVQSQRRALEAKYRNDNSQQQMFADMEARRKATYKQYKESFTSDIDAYTKALQDSFKGRTANDYVDADKFALINSKVEELSALKKQCQESNLVTDSDIEKANELQKSIDVLKSDLQPKVTKNGNFLAKFIDIDDAKQAMERAKTLLSETASKDGSTISFGDFKKNYTEMEYTLKTQDGTLQQYTARWDQATQSISTYMKKETEYTTQGQLFINSLKGKFAEITRYISVMNVVQKAMSFVKSGISAVVDINSAMTELKKVTDETEASYEKFGKTAGNIATEVGSTRKDITNSTADFARLGYSMEDSTKLAKNAAMYVNVGDGIDITTGTEDIVSTMKAFNIEADKSMHIVDVFNEVGNRFAISSSGIGEALKRSSSSMAAANNTFEETVAMATAMNEVLQDPALSGTTLKMLSLRLRGAKVELEDAGLDTEGMAESTSKLREQVMALTNVTGKGGFDIMKNNGSEFKSTYEMLKGISEVWNDMNDVDRAGLLELIAGKNRAQGAAALLSNFSQAEKALQVALNSDGSAEQENEKYLDSIQGKVTQLQASFQNLWANAVDDSVLGFIVNVGTNILKVVDNIGLLKTAIGALATVFSLNGVGRANAILNSCLSC